MSPRASSPRCCCPSTRILSIDEASFRAHLRDVGVRRGPLRDHHQRALDRGRLVHLRRAEARAGDRERRDRRAAADRPRRLRRRQPGGRAHREDGGRRRRLRAARLPARAVHPGPAAGDGGRAFQPHRRRERPADHRVPISARHGAGLPDGDAAEDVEAVPQFRAIKDWSACRITSGRSARCSPCRRR